MAVVARLLAWWLLASTAFGAITVTAKGTATAATGDCTITSVTIANGASVIVSYSIDGDDASSVTWNSLSLIIDVSAEHPDGGGGIASRHNVSGATGSVVVSSPTSKANKACAVFEATGLATTSAFDKSAAATGSSTSPSSGATATTAQANELLVGNVAAWASAANGTWSNSFTDLQNPGSGAAWLSQAYRIVSATGAYTAAKTGMSSEQAWSATIATYKEAAGGTSIKDPIMRGIIAFPR